MEMQVSTHPEDITILDVCAPNDRLLKYTTQKLLGLNPCLTPNANADSDPNI